MKEQRTRHATMFAVGLLVAGCEGALPKYPVPNTTLRLIPESSTTGELGSIAFVGLEFQQPVGQDNQPVVMFIRSDGAESVSLPGPTLCPSDASDGGMLGSDSDARTTGNADLIIPYSAMLEGSPPGNRRAGMLVKIPPGQQDATIVATAYHQDGQSSSCQVVDDTLVAVGFARIVRQKPASVVDAGVGSSAPEVALLQSSADAPLGGADGRVPMDASAESSTGGDTEPNLDQ